MIFFVIFIYIFHIYIFDGSFYFYEIHRLYKTQKRLSNSQHKQTMAVLGRLVRTARTWRTVASPKTLIPSPPRSRGLPRCLYHRTLLYLFTSIIIITLFIFFFFFFFSKIHSILFKFFHSLWRNCNCYEFSELIVNVIALNVWFASIFYF